MMYPNSGNKRVRGGLRVDGLGLGLFMRDAMSGGLLTKARCALLHLGFNEDA